MLETKEELRVTDEEILENILAITALDYEGDPKESHEQIAASRFRRWKTGHFNRKSCSRCRKFEPIAVFGSHHRTKDRKQPWCKECCATFGVLGGGKKAANQRRTFMVYDGG